MFKQINAEVVNGQTCVFTDVVAVQVDSLAECLVMLVHVFKKRDHLSAAKSIHLLLEDFCVTCYS